MVYSCIDIRVTVLEKSSGACLMNKGSGVKILSGAGLISFLPTFLLQHSVLNGGSSFYLTKNGFLAVLPRAKQAQQAEMSQKVSIFGSRSFYSFAFLLFLLISHQLDVEWYLCFVSPVPERRTRCCQTFDEKEAEDSWTSLGDKNDCFCFLVLELSCCCTW